MGGLGSGRSTDRPSTADALRFDVRAIHRRGLLRPGASGSVTWPKRNAAITFKVKGYERPERLHLTFRVNGERVAQSVRLSRQACHLGGHRAWAHCPSCDRRLAVLWLIERRFECRECLDLAYQSTRLTAGERHAARAAEIRLELGGSSDLLAAFPPRPKYQHRVTYMRLQTEERDRYLAALRVVAERIEARGGGSK